MTEIEMANLKNLVKGMSKEEMEAVAYLLPVSALMEAVAVKYYEAQTKLERITEVFNE